MNETIKKLIQDLKEFTPLFIEKNIFSIGGRGHYENPISDILSFFIDPQDQHGFGDVFLRAFFCYLKEYPDVLQLNSTPRREESTSLGNRLDIVAESDDWILVIENKIRHSVVNPFHDYANYIKKNYKNKDKFYFVVLSINKEVMPEDWINITYSELFDFVRNELSKDMLLHSLNKWHVILREFILSIESEYKDNKMQNEKFSFAQENYASLIDARNLLNEYISNIKEQLRICFEEIKPMTESHVIVNQETWNGCGIALRLSNSVWIKNASIVFLILNNGSYRIQFYIDSSYISEIKTQEESLHNLGFHKVSNEGKYIMIGFSDFNKYDSAFECFKETSLFIQNIGK